MDATVDGVLRSAEQMASLLCGKGVEYANVCFRGSGYANLVVKEEGKDGYRNWIREDGRWFEWRPM